MAGEKFFERMKARDAIPYFERIGVGGFTASIQGENKNWCPNPERVRLWTVMIFNLSIEELLPFLPDRLLDKYDAPPNKSSHSRFDHLTPRETQDLLDLLDRHGASIRENQPAPDEPTVKTAAGEKFRELLKPNQKGFIYVLEPLTVGGFSIDLCPTSWMRAPSPKPSFEKAELWEVEIQDITVEELKPFLSNRFFSLPIYACADAVYFAGIESADVQELLDIINDRGYDIKENQAMRSPVKEASIRENQPADDSVEKRASIPLSLASTPTIPLPDDWESDGVEITGSVIDLATNKPEIELHAGQIESPQEAFAWGGNRGGPGKFVELRFFFYSNVAGFPGTSAGLTEALADFPNRFREVDEDEVRKLGCHHNWMTRAAIEIIPGAVFRFERREDGEWVRAWSDVRKYRTLWVEVSGSNRTHRHELSVINIKAASMPLSLAKRKKEGPSDHPYDRPGVWRKNYDFGEGFGKMVDEFRDGKIKDTHEFIEKKRKEPNPIKDLYESGKKKKRKKVPLSKKAGQPEFEVSIYPMAPGSAHLLQDQKNFTDPNDAFRWARSQAGPGIWVVITPQFDAEQDADGFLVERFWQSRDGEDFKQYTSSTYSDMQEFYGRNQNHHPHFWQTTGRKPNIVPWLGEFDAQYKLSDLQLPLSKKATEFDIGLPAEFFSDRSHASGEVWATGDKSAPIEKFKNEDDPAAALAWAKSRQGPGHDVWIGVVFDDKARQPLTTNNLRVMVAQNSFPQGFRQISIDEATKIAPEFVNESQADANSSCVIESMWYAGFRLQSSDGGPFKIEMRNVRKNDTLWIFTADDYTFFPFPVQRFGPTIGHRVNASVCEDFHDYAEEIPTDGSEADEDAKQDFVNYADRLKCEPKKAKASEEEAQISETTCSMKVYINGENIPTISKTFPDPQTAFQEARRHVGPGHEVFVIPEFLEERDGKFVDRLWASDNGGDFRERPPGNFSKVHDQPLFRTDLTGGLSVVPYLGDFSKMMRMGSALPLTKRAGLDLQLPDGFETDNMHLGVSVYHQSGFEEGASHSRKRELIEEKKFGDPNGDPEAAYEWASRRIGPGQLVSIFAYAHQTDVEGLDFESLDQSMAKNPNLWQTSTGAEANAMFHGSHFEPDTEVWIQTMWNGRWMFRSGDGEPIKNTGALITKNVRGWYVGMDGRPHYHHLKREVPVQSGEFFGRRASTTPPLSKRAATPQVDLPADFSTDSSSFQAIDWHKGLTHESFYGTSPEDCFNWAKHRIGPGHEVKVLANYSDYTPENGAQLRAAAEKNPPKYEQLSFEAAYDRLSQQTRNALENGDAHADDDSFILAHQKFASFVWTSKDGADFVLESRKVSNLDRIYWTFGNDQIDWNWPANFTHAETDSLLTKSARFAFHRPPDLKHAQVAALVSVYEGQSLKNSQGFDRDDQAAKWADQQVAHGVRVKLALDYFEGGDVGPKEDDLKAAAEAAPHRFSKISAEEVAQLNIAPTVQRAVQKAGGAIIEHRVAARLQYESKDGGPFGLTDESRSNAAVLYWIQHGRVYQVRLPSQIKGASIAATAAVVPTLPLPDDFTTDLSFFWVSVAKHGETASTRYDASSLEDAFKKAENQIGPGMDIEIVAGFTNNAMKVDIDSSANLEAACAQHPSRFKKLTLEEGNIQLEELGFENVENQDAVESADLIVLRIYNNASFTWESKDGGPIVQTNNSIQSKRKLYVAHGNEISATPWRQLDLT